MTISSNQARILVVTINLCSDKQAHFPSQAQIMTETGQKRPTNMNFITHSWLQLRHIAQQRVESEVVMNLMSSNEG